MCLEIEASSRLNFFSDQPHVLVLHIYPLSNGTTFGTLSARDMIAGERPSGMTEDRRTLEVEPGQSIALADPLPRDTVELGLLADFYGSAKKAIVSAECGLFRGEKILLSANDLQVSP